MINLKVITFDFIDHEYKQIDYKTINEIKSGIYKAFALICGSYLASYFKSEFNIKKTYLNKINNQLTKDV